MLHRLRIDSTSRALVSAVLCSILGLLALAACNSFTPTAALTPTRAIITQIVVATRVETRVPIPMLAPSNRKAILTSTGKVTQVESITNLGQVRVKLSPDDPAMRSEFIIGGWNNLTVLFYWAGLETPTPLVSANAKQELVQNSLGCQVTIGYQSIDSSSAASEPSVVLFSAHKQPGDVQ